MTNLVTVAQVRQTSGVQSDITDDATITALISEIEERILSSLKVFKEPTKVIDVLHGNNKTQIALNRPYVWKVLEIKSRDSELDLSNIHINPISSIITIDNTSNPYYFEKYLNSIKVKYLSAFMEKTTTITETSADIEAGNSVVIAVDDESSFSVDDWILIEGLDGNIEATKITAVSDDDTTITVDLLVQDHESESLITKLQTHELLTQYVRYESAVAVGINAIGGSYNFATGYTYPEYSAQKGVPYPHFQKNVEENKNKSDEVKNQIYNKLNPIS